MLENTVFSDVSLFEKKSFAIGKVSSQVQGCNSCYSRRDPSFLKLEGSVGAEGNWVISAFGGIVD